MPDPHLLNYSSTPRPSPRPLCAGLGGALLGIAILIYLLFELQRMPYRPPYDMSTLLGGGEIQLVRFVIAILSVAWLACALALVWIAWRIRSGKSTTPRVR